MNEQMNEWVGVLHTVTLTQPSAAGPNCRGGRAPPSTPEQGSAENSHHWDEGAEGRAGGTHAVTTPWPARPAPSDRSGSGGTESCPPAPCTRPSTCTVEADERTHDAVLHAEAQLVLEVRPLDEDGGDWRAADDVQLHLCLVLQTLRSRNGRPSGSQMPLGGQPQGPGRVSQWQGRAPGAGGPSQAGPSQPWCPSVRGCRHHPDRMQGCWASQVAVRAVAPVLWCALCAARVPAGQASGTSDEGLFCACLSV